MNLTVTEGARVSCW